MLENIGVGIDIVDVSRFENIPYISNQEFYNKNFSQEEIKYCTKFKTSAQHFAGKFAAKEALKKSVTNNVKMIDIITSHLNSKPIIKIKNQQKYNFVLSISHEKKFATAIVISELKN
jgi:holo-[acyl-carrier protein] synthase